MLGVLGQRRQQGQGIERGDGGRALQRLHRHVQHGQVIGHEEGVELAALQGLGVGDQRLEIEVGVRRAARIAPGGCVDRDRAHERAEAELFLGHGFYLASASADDKEINDAMSSSKHKKKKGLRKVVPF